MKLASKDKTTIFSYLEIVAIAEDCINTEKYDKIAQIIGEMNPKINNSAIIISNSTLKNLQYESGNKAKNTFSLKTLKYFYNAIFTNIDKLTISQAQMAESIFDKLTITQKGKYSILSTIHKFLSPLPQKTENQELDTYEKYLTNFNYISRSEFKRVKFNDKNFITEEDISNRIIENPEKSILIYGEGGVGKTRLMLEVGRIVQSKSVEVYKINKDVTAERYNDDIDKLKKNIDPNRRYLFLLDYIEEYNDISILLDSFQDEKNVLFLANCRAEYFFKNRFPLTKFFKDYHVGGVSDIEKNYKKHVVSEILKFGKTTFSGKIIPPPALAVFYNFVNEKDIQRGLVNSSDNHVDEFKNWVIRRFARTFPLNGKIKKKSIIGVLACLPLISSEIEALVEDTEINSIKDSLEIDFWIAKDSEKKLRVVQDTITDVLLTEFFTEVSESQIEDRINGFLEFIEKRYPVSSYVITNSLRSLERMYENINNTTFSKAIETKLDSWIKHNTIRTIIKFKYFQTTLIEFNSRLNKFILLANTSDDFYSQGPFFSYFLSFKEKITTTQKKELKNIISKKWKIITDFTERPQAISVLIPRYIETYSIDENVITWVNNLTQYYLSNGGAIKLQEGKIGFLFKALFESDNFFIKYSYLIKFEYFLFKWLRNIQESKEISSQAKFTIYTHNYEHYLKSNLKFDKPILLEIINWLKINYTQFYSSYVFQALIQKIEECKNKELQKTCLDEFSKVQFYFWAWFDLYKDNYSNEQEDCPARVVGKWMMMKKQHIGSYKHKILEWINASTYRLEIHFVIQQWLKNGGEPHLIEDAIEKWLKNFSGKIEGKEDKHIFKAWLEKEYNCENEIINSFCLKFIEANCQGEKTEMTPYICRIWISKYKNIDDIKIFILKWIYKLLRYETQIYVEPNYTIIHQWLENEINYNMNHIMQINVHKDCIKLIFEYLYYENKVALNDILTDIGKNENKARVIIKEIMKLDMKEFAYDFAQTYLSKLTQIKENTTMTQKSILNSLKKNYTNEVINVQIKNFIETNKSIFYLTNKGFINGVNEPEW